MKFVFDLKKDREGGFYHFGVAYEKDYLALLFWVWSLEISRVDGETA